jgi:predicted Zn-dependent protease with MMP-like domain
MSARGQRPPGLLAFTNAAERALASLPAGLRDQLEGLALRVDDWPDGDTLQEMEIDSPYELLGLYRGVSLMDKGAGISAEHVDMIFLYRMPILDAWIHGEDTLEALIHHVVIHEIGHHFGLSDADMEAIEANVDA